MIRLRSYAKLNLYLAVLGKRPDKYHELVTVFERISLYDTITLKERCDGRITLSTDSLQIPADSSNLAWKSAELLQKKFKIGKGVDIRIEKRIPVGAGLAGGSSNAAAVLLGLNKLWKLGLSREKLAKLGRSIGADVAFFIYDTPFALGRGRGERISPLPWNRRRLWHLVCMPDFSVPTPLIYKKWDELGKKARLTNRPPDVKILTSKLKCKTSSDLSNCLFNSLEQVTIKLYPEVGRIKDVLRPWGIGAILMSGSGPAVFGILSSRRLAEAIKLKTERALRCKVYIAGTV